MAPPHSLVPPPQCVRKPSDGGGGNGDSILKSCSGSETPARFPGEEERNWRVTQPPLENLEVKENPGKRRKEGREEEGNKCRKKYSYR